MFKTARVKIATDTQWSRILTFLCISEMILLFIFISLYIFTLGIYSGIVEEDCKNDNEEEWTTTVVIASLAAIVGSE
jgi:hypothetical protein